MDSWKDVTLGDVAKGFRPYRPFISPPSSRCSWWRCCCRADGDNDRRSIPTSAARSQRRWRRRRPTARRRVDRHHWRRRRGRRPDGAGRTGGADTRIDAPPVAARPLPVGARRRSRLRPDDRAHQGAVDVRAAVPWRRSAATTAARRTRASPRKRSRSSSTSRRRTRRSTRRSPRPARTTHADDSRQTYAGLHRLLQQALPACTGARSSSTSCRAAATAEDDAAAARPTPSTSPPGSSRSRCSARRRPTSFVDELAAAQDPVHLHRVAAAGDSTSGAPVRGLHAADGVDAGLHPPRRVRRQAARRSQRRTCAGTPAFKAQKRVFGLLYYETPDLAYRAAREFFEKQLHDKYGIVAQGRARRTAARPTMRGLQEQARPLIQKMKDEGVTSDHLRLRPDQPGAASRRRRRGSTSSRSGSSPARR